MLFSDRSLGSPALVSPVGPLPRLLRWKPHATADPRTNVNDNSTHTSEAGSGVDLNPSPVIGDKYMQIIRPRLASGPSKILAVIDGHLLMVRFLLRQKR
jgi:hypothetical protein